MALDVESEALQLAPCRAHVACPECHANLVVVGHEPMVRARFAIGIDFSCPLLHLLAVVLFGIYSAEPQVAIKHVGVVVKLFCQLQPFGDDVDFFGHIIADSRHLLIDSVAFPVRFCCIGLLGECFEQRAVFAALLVVDLRWRWRVNSKAYE